MQLSVIIVNYNVKHFLEQCIFSVLKAAKNLKFEIIVVDNNSSDGSSGFLKQNFPSIILIQNSANAGFSKACNQGLQKSTGEIILFLNPDTIVSESSLESAFCFVSTQKNCGAAGIKMIDGKGNFLKESLRSFPGVFSSFFKLSGLADKFPDSKFFASYYMAGTNNSEINETDIIAGAFFIVKKSVLAKTGSFDPAFFMYGEDVDLSFRIKKYGFKNYFLPNPVIHFKGESTIKNDDYFKNFYGAMSIFVNKHYNKFYSSLIKNAISFARKLSQKKSSEIKPCYKNQTLAIIGNCIYLIPHLSKYFEKIINLESVDTLPETTHILFDQNKYDADFIIGFAFKNAGKYCILIHFPNSKSIIFSNNKNSKGTAISFN